jgi:hypothetical protein
MFVMQGVRELLKGASKDSYTLRFATEGEAQHWLTAFRLIIKVEFRLRFCLRCDRLCGVFQTSTVCIFHSPVSAHTLGGAAHHFRSKSLIFFMIYDLNLVFSKTLQRSFMLVAFALLPATHALLPETLVFGLPSGQYTLGRSMIHPARPLLLHQTYIFGTHLLLVRRRVAER